MTFLEIYSRVKNLSQVNNVDRAKNAVNIIYRHFVNRFFWPQFVLTATITPVSGTQGYALADDYRWIKWVYYRSSGSGTPIPIRSSRGVFPDEQSLGTPFIYRIKKDSGVVAVSVQRNWKIFFYSIPNQVFIDTFTEIEYEYYYQPLDLSADTDIPRFDTGDHDALIMGAVVLLTGKQGDVPGFTMFKTLFEEHYAAMEDKAINFMGRPIVGPGPEIVEDGGHIISDYGLGFGGVHEAIDL